MTQITQSHHMAGLLQAQKPQQERETQITQSTHVAGIQGTAGQGEVEGSWYQPVRQHKVNVHLCPNAGQS